MDFKELLKRNNIPVRVRSGQDEDGNPYVQIDIQINSHRVSVITKKKTSTIFHNGSRSATDVSDGEVDRWFKTFVDIWIRRK